MKITRKVLIADYVGARAHLVVAYHGPDRRTVTTLCSEPDKRWWPAPADAPLCQHCTNVRADLAAVA